MSKPSQLKKLVRSINPIKD